MTHRLCFGYGSLVNQNTHEFQLEGADELNGWCRIWGHRITSGKNKVTSLSIRPAKDTTIKGLLLRVAPDQIAGLDAREAGYRLASLESSELVTRTDPTHTYISEIDTVGNEEFPILQSYLDTVLHGFHLEFGAGGVTHFIETTLGWETPILKDRANPIYPRTTKISREFADFVDGELTNYGATWLS